MRVDEQFENEKTSFPLVSIGVPTYNRPDGLKRALQCLKEQTYQNLEIIVSDNCSTSKEVEHLMSELIRHDTRIRYFRQDTNIGAIPNFEFVLNEANGKYFAWAADDDLCEKNFIEKLVDCMERYPDVVLCGCDVQSIDENDKPLELNRLNSIGISESWRSVQRLFFRYPTSNVFFCIYGLYKTEILKRCDLNILLGWKKSGANGEVPFLAKISTWGRIAAIPEVLKIYRRHPDSSYYREIKRRSKFDAFMLKLIIRFKLIKIALACPCSLLTKVSLLSTIAGSFISSINFAGTISAVLPLSIKKQLKKICK